MSAHLRWSAGECATRSVPLHGAASQRWRTAWPTGYQTRARPAGERETVSPPVEQPHTEWIASEVRGGHSGRVLLRRRLRYLLLPAFPITLASCRGGHVYHLPCHTAQRGRTVHGVISWRPAPQWRDPHVRVPRPLRGGRVLPFTTRADATLQPLPCPVPACAGRTRTRPGPDPGSPGSARSRPRCGTGSLRVSCAAAVRG